MIPPLTLIKVILLGIMVLTSLGIAAREISTPSLPLLESWLTVISVLFVAAVGGTVVSNELREQMALEAMADKSRQGPWPAHLPKPQFFVIHPPNGQQQQHGAERCSSIGAAANRNTSSNRPLQFYSTVTVPKCCQQNVSGEVLHQTTTGKTKLRAPLMLNAVGGQVGEIEVAAGGGQTEVVSPPPPRSSLASAFELPVFRDPAKAKAADEQVKSMLLYGAVAAFLLVLTYLVSGSGRTSGVLAPLFRPPSSHHATHAHYGSARTAPPPVASHYNIPAVSPQCASPYCPHEQPSWFAHYY